MITWDAASSHIGGAGSAWEALKSGNSTCVQSVASKELSLWMLILRRRLHLLYGSGKTLVASFAHKRIVFFDNCVAEPLQTDTANCQGLGGQCRC